MNKLLLIALLFLVKNVYATFSQTMYVAAASGLRVHKSPSINSPVIEHLSYGDAVVIQLTEYETIKADGFTTHWVPINNGKGANGYILNAYLLPFLPPDTSASGLKEYAEQLSNQACAPVICKDVNELDWDMKDTKLLYKNGMVFTENTNYEYLSKSLIIPGITIEEAFIIARNINETRLFLPENGRFPESSTYQSAGNGGYNETTLYYYENHNKSYKRLEKVTFAVDDKDNMGSISLVQLNGQVAIIYEYGS